MNSMFSGCKKIKRIEMGNWNVDNVDYLRMEWAFHGCESLEIVEIPNLKKTKFKEFSRNCLFIGCNEDLNITGTCGSLSLMFECKPKLRFKKKKKIKEMDDKCSYSIKDNKDKNEFDIKVFKKI